MKQNERDVLQRAIEAVRNYDQDKRSPYHMEHCLLKLHEVDQSANEDLWDMLRAAFAENEQINRSATRKFLSRKYFAEKGYWWWNPEKWPL